MRLRPMTKIKWMKLRRGNIVYYGVYRTPRKILKLHFHHPSTFIKLKKLFISKPFPMNKTTLYDIQDRKFFYYKGK